MTTIRICIYKSAMYICVCHAVNERRIEQVAREGVRNIKQLCVQTRTGTRCGKCLPDAKQVLERAVASVANNALADVA